MACIQLSTTNNDLPFLQNDKSHFKPLSVSAAGLKTSLVDSLVNSTVNIMKSIWSHNDLRDSVSYQLSLTTFLQEILKRSRTSFSTLQVTLFHLIKFRDSIQDYLVSLRLDESSEKELLPDCLFLLDERKTFLICLLISTKYLNDKSFSINVWSKVSGLNKADLIKWEFLFLNHIMKWNLFINVEDFNNWCTSLWLNPVCASRNKADDKQQPPPQQRQRSVSTKHAFSRRIPMMITTPNNSPMLGSDLTAYDQSRQEKTAEKYCSLLRGLMTPPVDTWTPTHKRDLEDHSEFEAKDDFQTIKRCRM